MFIRRLSFCIIPGRILNGTGGILRIISGVEVQYDPELAKDYAAYMLGQIMAEMKKEPFV